MITEEREKAGTAQGPPRLPPVGDPTWPWWRGWPAPFGRPQPINRRSLLVGGAVVTVALLALDGFLAAVAGYAAGSLVAGLAVFAGLFVFNWLEFALVAWATRRRQEHEKRRAR